MSALSSGLSSAAQMGLAGAAIGPGAGIAGAVIGGLVGVLGSVSANKKLDE